MSENPGVDNCGLGLGELKTGSNKTRNQGKNKIQRDRNVVTIRTGACGGDERSKKHQQDDENLRCSLTFCLLHVESGRLFCFFFIFIFSFFILYFMVFSGCVLHPRLSKMTVTTQSSRENKELSTTGGCGDILTTKDNYNDNNDNDENEDKEKEKENNCAMDLENITDKQLKNMTLDDLEQLLTRWTNMFVLTASTSFYVFLFDFCLVALLF